MNMNQLDNIVVGTLVEGLTLEDLGVHPFENTLHITMDQAKELNLSLPKLLVHVGLFSSTSEIKRLNQQRVKNDKIVDPLSKDLWRSIDKPEMTFFKIGKKVFWLIVGE